MGHERFESLERSLSDSHRLSNLDFRIEYHDLFFICHLSQVRNRVRIQCCHLIAESNKALDSGRVLDLPMLPRINKLCEQVAWEHRFDEPNGSSAGRPPETQSRREARYLQLPAQCGSRNMLMLWLGPHTKPKRRLDLCQLGERIRHGRKIWRMDHTGAVRFFKRPRPYVVSSLNPIGAYDGNVSHRFTTNRLE
jgi:hypothetical protein